MIYDGRKIVGPNVGIGYMTQCNALLPCNLPTKVAVS